MPIYKGKDKHYVIRTRDVSDSLSLLSVICKLAERCVNNAVYPRVSSIIVNGSSINNQLVRCFGNTVNYL